MNTRGCKTNGIEALAQGARFHENQAGEEIAMAGDPREYRQNARRCVELAKQAKTPEQQQTLLNLSSAWLKFAIEVERSQAFLDEHPSTVKKPA